MNPEVIVLILFSIIAVIGLIEIIRTFALYFLIKGIEEGRYENRGMKW